MWAQAGSVATPRVAAHLPFTRTRADSEAVAHQPLPMFAVGERRPHTARR
jgi:hypothetical protein